LAALLASITSSRQSASAALEVEREASQSGQTEAGNQGFMVRQFFYFSAPNVAFIKNERAWIGQFGRVT
jgi:hypothetical protein